MMLSAADELFRAVDELVDQVFRDSPAAASAMKRVLSPENKLCVVSAAMWELCTDEVEHLCICRTLNEVGVTLKSYSQLFTGMQPQNRAGLHRDSGYMGRIANQPLASSHKLLELNVKLGSPSEVRP